MKMHAGIYIHIPFCRSRCSYCDFATGMYESGIAERYVRALCSEVNDWREIAQPSDVDSIYFGGGTPSLLKPTQIARILNSIKDRFEVGDSAEITLEINPGSGGTSAPSKQTESGLDAAVVRRHSQQSILRELHALGINRASFGAQTFDDRELKQLGRTHGAADISTTFQQLRETGFANINLDLIAG